MEARQVVTAVRADQRARFLLVGGFNTALGYLVYASLVAGIGDRIAPVVCFALSHVVCSPIAFLLYRHQVFGTGRNWLLDFIRFQLVYLAAFLTNIVLLWFMTQPMSVNPYLAQAVALAVVAVSSFVGHRSVSFRRPASGPGAVV